MIFNYIFLMVIGIFFIFPTIQPMKNEQHDNLELCIKIFEGVRYCNSIDFNFDGTFLAMLGHSSVAFFDVLTGKKIKEIGKGCKRTDVKFSTLAGMACSPYENKIAIAVYPIILNIFDISTGESVQELINHGVHSPTAYISFTRKEKVRIVTCPNDFCRNSIICHRGITDYWDSKNLKLSAIHRGEKTLIRGLFFNNNWDWVNDCASTPDGKYVAIATNCHGAIIWNTRTEKSVSAIKYNCLLSAVKLNSENILACGAWNNNIDLWAINEDTQEYKTITLHGHADKIIDLAFSSCGRILVSIAYDKTIKIWDIHLGVCLQSIDLEINPYRLAMCKQGKLAAATSEGTVFIFDISQILEQLQKESFGSIFYWFFDEI